jgi:hypothetical protein
MLAWGLKKSLISILIQAATTRLVRASFLSYWCAIVQASKHQTLKHGKNPKKTRYLHSNRNLHLVLWCKAMWTHASPMPRSHKNLSVANCWKNKSMQDCSHHPLLLLRVLEAGGLFPKGKFGLALSSHPQSSIYQSSGYKETIGSRHGIKHIRKKSASCSHNTQIVKDLFLFF